MTRTTDDLHSERFQPLGKPEPRPAPPPPPAPTPQGPYGVVQDKDGRFHTTRRP